MNNQCKIRSSPSSKLVPLLAKSGTPEQSHVAKKTPVVFAGLLALLLLAGINPLLSTALADGGTAAIVPVLLSTFTNPTPAANSDYFGASVAAVGNDRVLIGAFENDTGATGSGAAYLFSTNGTLLTTFTNPTPATSDWFGYSVAAVGSDRVLIGAYGDDTGAVSAGAAYLFSTNGTLLTTFTNPTPATGDLFGYSVAAVGNDRVLIGAYLDDTGRQDAGAAYLFSTNGTLLTTITNPAPFGARGFGWSVAVVGDDHVVIGSAGPAPFGHAYLLSTNGMLLTSFTNPPTSAVPVAAMGSDRVLIATPGPGVVYLFNTNGTLLTTFTDPAPADLNDFGRAVAALGNDRIIISARGTDTVVTDAGAVYLFSTNGTLLATITNPTPTAGDYFGWSVAAVGNDRVLIGTYLAGEAYLFALVPSLDIQPTPTNTLAVSWPLFAPDFLLQQNTNGLATVNWSNVTDTIQDDGTNKYLIIDPATGNRFYRLSKPSQ